MRAATLIRPKFLSVINRWKRQEARRSSDIIIFCFALFIGGITYAGTLSLLNKIAELPFAISLPPHLVLGLILLLLSGMLFISSLASALANFYLAEDLELILSTPVSMLSIFAARLTSVTCSVSWMPFLFLFPLFLAFGHALHAPWWFPFASLSVLIPYFVIPTALSVVLSSLVVSLLGPRWTKIFGILIVAATISGLVIMIEVISSLFRAPDINGRILHIVRFFASANLPYVPSAWASVAISEILVPTGRSISARVELLYAVAVFCCSLAYTSVEFLHPIGITKARGAGLRKYGSSNSTRTYSFLTTRLRGFSAKDLRATFRDLAQSLQLLFLGVMCLMYLTNLKFFFSLDFFPDAQRTWWANFLFIVNICIGAFFTIAVCSRLVFSSVSLEGKSWWIIQTAPVTFHDVLKAKSRLWYPPVAALSAVVFGTGALAIIGRFDVALVFVITSLFISFALVQLGIGLGAKFANFDWDHPSQLALGLGNFVYMASGVMLIFFNIFPLLAVINLLPISNWSLESLMTARGAAALSILCFTALFNLLVGKVALIRAGRLER